MNIVPLSPVANQKVSFSADGNYWQVRIFQAASYMAVDITRDGEMLVAGFRVVEGTLVIPYDYLWKFSSGNLLFRKEPDWEKFGADCPLYYLTNAEAILWESLHSA